MSEDWICVHVAANRGEAELLAGILRDEGISVQIRGTDITSHGPFFPEIVVPESHATRAFSLLDGASKTATSSAPSQGSGAKGGAPYLWFLGGAVSGAVVVLLLSTRMEPARHDGAYSYDANGDGKPDTWEHWTHGTLQHAEYDRNHDGRVDEWAFGKQGQIVERRWSLRRNGTIDKKAFYRFGIKTEEHFDLDGDGVFETKKLYDAFEQEKPAP